MTVDGRSWPLFAMLLAAAGAALIAAGSTASSSGRPSPEDIRYIRVG
jgi:hypothetical protein